jgi:hypothetical protein
MKLWPLKAVSKIALPPKVGFRILPIVRQNGKSHKSFGNIPEFDCIDTGRKNERVK